VIRVAGVVLRTACVVALLCCAGLAAAAGASAALPPIKHVFVLIDENEAAATTFGAASPAPYLSRTLVARGAYLPNYYGVGHNSLDNYIAMVSGQAPNPSTSADCPTFADFPAPTSMDAAGQENGQGCVYPANVPTLMSQLGAAGLTWRAYEDGMGADPTREAATCGHPPVGSPDNTEVATAQDQYATRHDPFVYFHSVIDHQASCNAHVVNLNQLPADLHSAATTPNYVFITPNLCDDGHDATCANGGPGGLAQADTFLKTWVPQITGSPAFKKNGLLIVTFDESVGDATACCGEMPGPFDQANHILPGGSGPGGGVVGAVLLSPFIAPGTKSNTPYNHYSMLGSIEDLFGLRRLADASGTVGFGSDVYTRPPAVAPQDSDLMLGPASFTPQPGARTLPHHGTTISYRDSQVGVSTLTIERTAPGYRQGHQACKALSPGHTRPRHAKACTVTSTVGRITHRDTAGVNRVSFTGRWRGHPLTAGSYLLGATPALGGLRGATKTATFRIV
jgi:hypothetical protein